MKAVRARLGVLCEQITRHADMEQAIRDAGAGVELDEVLAFVRGSQDPADPPGPGGSGGPPALSDADAAALIALLDRIDHACAVDGMAAVTTVSKGFTPLPDGFGGAVREPLTWICPLTRCARTVFEDEATATPTCVAGGGVPMRPVKVLE